MKEVCIQLIGLLKNIFPSLITMLVAFWSFKKGFEKDERIEYIKNVRRNEVEIKLILDDLSKLAHDMNRFDDNNEIFSSASWQGMLETKRFLFDKNYSIFEMINYHQVRKAYNVIYRDITILSKDIYAKEKLDILRAFFEAVNKFESCLKEKFENEYDSDDDTSELTDELDRAALNLFESSQKSVEAIKELMEIDLYDHNKIWRFFNKILNCRVIAAIRNYVKKIKCRK